MTDRIPESLRTYVEEQILPRHDGFDAVHRRDHVETVIRQSLALAARYRHNRDAYTAAKTAFITRSTRKAREEQTA